MARQESASEIKQRLVAELRDARLGLAQESKAARDHYRPTAIAARSFQQHKIGWIIGGTIAGLLAVRLLLPTKNRSDISGKSAKKRGFSGLLSGIALTLAQRAAMNYAKDHLQNHFKDTFSTFFDRPGPRP
jgi:hypothetical protein